MWHQEGVVLFNSVGQKELSKLTWCIMVATELAYAVDAETYTS